MSQLLIEIDSEEDKALLLALLPRLHARVINSEDSKLKKDRFIKGLHEIAARGALVSHLVMLPNGNAKYAVWIVYLMGVENDSRQ